jgi:glycosyltransferase involved in cell wall biosynthesis
MAKGQVRVGVILSDGMTARGGIGRVVTYLVRQLQAHVPDVAPRVFRARYSTRAGLKHLTMPAALARFAAAAPGLHVIHINIAPRGSTWRKMAFARVARALGKPVLLHLHGSGYDDYYASRTPAQQAAIRRFFGGAEAVVVLSPYWHRFMTGTLGAPAERVHIIANGVPAADPPVAPRVVAATPTILFLGEVGERKGIDVFLRTLARLAGEGLPWRAVVGGNGAVEAAQAEAARLGIGDRIAFLGWVGEAEVDAQLRAADLYVLPSRAENQPVAILEAMARAVPVVASRVGGIPEQLADGAAGLLVEPGDPYMLADAIARLLADPELRARLGETGRERFAAHYALSACAERFAGLYRALDGR